MTEDDAALRETAPVDSGLERLLMRPRTARFALWQALLAAIVGVLALILFGSFALEGQEKNANILERAAHAIASGPITANRLLSDVINRNHPRAKFHDRFQGEYGFSKGPARAPLGDALLLSRYDGDRNQGVVEFVDLDTGAVLHEWRPDIDSINALSELPEKVTHLKRDFNRRRYVYHAPLTDEDGSLVFNGMNSPLVKVDICGRVVWTVEGVFHHSIERDADGNIWSAEKLRDSKIRFVDDQFSDDAIVAVSPDGERLFSKSVSQLLIDAGYRHLIYASDGYTPDPIHMNDVQPVPGDGPYWKKGDIFLSLRSPSAVLLYRPSTDEILWMRQGPWLLQHDVDILSDHKIGVFNNNAVMSPYGPRVDGTSNIVVYDFETDKTRVAFAEAFETLAVRTNTNGLFAARADGSVMVEEHDEGRLIAFDESGGVHWSYVNRAPKDGRIFDLGWTRYLEPQEATALKAAVEKADCGAR